MALAPALNLDAFEAREVLHAHGDQVAPARSSRHDRKAHPGLQMMHELRKVQTPLSSEHRSHADVFQHLKARQLQLDGAKRQLGALGPPSLRTSVGSVLANNQRSALANQIGMLEAGAGARPELMQLLETADKQGMSSPDFLTYAVPSVQFFWLTKPPTPSDLEAMLRCYGPIYASGHLSLMKARAGGAARQSFEGRVVDAVEDLSPGEGRHAVVIAGVTSAGQIWYKDPNYSDVYQRIEFAKFMGGPHLAFLAVKCFLGNGACPHLAGRLILNIA